MSQHQPVWKGHEPFYLNATPSPRTAKSPINTRSGYVIDDTADLQSTRHLTQATSCRTIYEMPFAWWKTEP